MFATVGIYTFGSFDWLTCHPPVSDCCPIGAPMISVLFVVFPCFEGGDEQMMVRNLLSA